MPVKGWTLAELLVIIAILALLASLLVPSLSAARSQARLASCAASMHSVHVAVMSYAADHDRRMMPFAFSADLPLSGHWGGVSQANDPDAFAREGVAHVNFGALTAEEYASSATLICPGADGDVRKGSAGYFPHTKRFSTYCLRFPYSEDLFVSAPLLAYRDGSLLGVYAKKAGGQLERVGKEYYRVPLVRIDLLYATAADAACGDGVYTVATDAMLADAFWRQEHSVEAPQTAGGLEGYPVRAAWYHGAQFNVC